MGNVKGSILLDWVKAVRADKKGSYDKLLSDADKEIVARTILPSSWYPFETYMACFKAVAWLCRDNP